MSFWELRKLELFYGKKYFEYIQTLTDFFKLLKPEGMNIHSIGDEILEIELVKHSIIFDNVRRNGKGIKFIVSGEIKFVAVLFHVF